MDEFAVAVYVGRTALAGAVVLALGRAALTVARSPATRQRLAAGTLRAAVLVPLLTLLPSWWAITVPAATPAAVVEVVAAEPVALIVEWGAEPQFVEAEEPAFDAVGPPPQAVIVVPEPVVVAPAAREWAWRDAVAVVAAVYAAGVAYFLGLFALGHLALLRLRRGATLAPGRVRAAWGPRRSPALLVHDGLASPVCFGVVRPAVVLPTGLAKSATAGQLAWVLAHEADHLRRGDPLTGWFAGLAKALYYFVPWFWGVRRELRLAQEYLADAAALAAGGHAADYAEFLVDLTAAPVRGRRTLLAHGVRAGRSDLSRRITMVLSTTPPRATKRWATPAAAGLFAVAVALSGVTFVRADDKPKEPPAAPQPADVKPPADKPTEATPRQGDDVFRLRSEDSAAGLRLDLVKVQRMLKQLDEAIAAGKPDEMKRIVEALDKMFDQAAPVPPTPLSRPERQVVVLSTPLSPFERQVVVLPTPPSRPERQAVVPPTPLSPPERLAVEQRGILVIQSADPRIMDALTAMRKAIDATKDPEARAAMETAFKLLRDMPQERKTAQAFAGPDGRVTVVVPPPGESRERPAAEKVVPAPGESRARPAAKKVRFETLKLEVLNGGFSIEAKKGDRQYKVTGVMVGERQIDKVDFTITDLKTGDGAGQSGTVLDKLDERDRAAVQTLLDQIRRQ